MSSREDGQLWIMIPAPRAWVVLKGEVVWMPPGGSVWWWARHAPHR